MIKMPRGKHRYQQAWYCPSCARFALGPAFSESRLDAPTHVVCGTPMERRGVPLLRFYRLRAHLYSACAN